MLFYKIDIGVLVRLVACGKRRYFKAADGKGAEFGDGMKFDKINFFPEFIVLGRLQNFAGLDIAVNLTVGLPSLIWQKQPGSRIMSCAEWK